MPVLRLEGGGKTTVPSGETEKAGAGRRDGRGFSRGQATPAKLGAPLSRTEDVEHRQGWSRRHADWRHGTALQGIGSARLGLLVADPMSIY